MNPAAWVTVGVKIAKAIILGVNAIEGSGTTATGDTKRELALKIARDAMTMCGNEAIPYSPEVQQALKEYNDAYVKLQNVLAAASK